MCRGLARRALAVSGFLLLCLAAAAGRAESQAPIVLWPDGAPGALGKAEQDVPTLTPYLPAKERATGAAMVICPGGAYLALAPHEGHDYALFLNQQGVAAFVLKYRLGSAGYRHPAPWQDAARAVRTVRARAGEWQIDPRRVGIMGSSAGGHLAATLLTHFDAGQPAAQDPIERQSSRPDLGVLCYPVITMGTNTHEGSRAMLLGKNPAPELIRELSNEEHVTAQTPPCFIWHTWEDPRVKVENSLGFAAALQRQGVPLDLHIYTRGIHGIGLVDKPPFAHPHPWAQDLVFWLREWKFVR